jgi:adenine-specific DNA-methyltransferase
MSQESDPNTNIERVDLQSLDVAEQKRLELLRLFPEVRTEDGKIDFDRLKLTLGATVDAGKERYGLTWPGKDQRLATAYRIALRACGFAGTHRGVAETWACCLGC